MKTDAGVIRGAGVAASFALRREGYGDFAAFAGLPTSHFAELRVHPEDFLHPRELETFRKLKVERRQTSYLLGRCAAKLALEEWVGPRFVASSCCIASGIFSQPVVHGAGLQPLGVSISHSERFACALAFPEEHPMAVDVEEVDPERTPTMRSQIGDNEAALANAACGGIDLAATVLWTAKEALSKVLRCGMTCPYVLLEISEIGAADGSFAGHFRNFAQYRFCSWQRGKSVVTFVLPKRTEIAFSPPSFSS